MTKNNIKFFKSLIRLLKDPKRRQETIEKIYQYFFLMSIVGFAIGLFLSVAFALIFKIESNYYKLVIVFSGILGYCINFGYLKFISFKNIIKRTE